MKSKLIKKINKLEDDINKIDFENKYMYKKRIKLAKQVLEKSTLLGGYEAIKLIKELEYILNKNKTR